MNSEKMSTDRLATLKYNVHTLHQHRSKEELNKISSILCLPVHLMLLNFDGNMNIAMSIRSAAVMGCSDIWIVGKRKYDARPEVGAKNYIRVHKIDILENPREFFESKGVHPILVEQGGVPLETMNFKRFFDLPVCFIMGSEGKGVPREWIDLIPTHVSISQYGLLRSFNVSIAASIVMYEYVKQLGARVKES